MILWDGLRKMTFELAEKEIEKRRRVVQRIVFPLTGRAVEVNMKSAFSGLTVLTGTRKDSVAESVERCRARNIFVNYYEHWSFGWSRDRGRLERMYMHLYRSDSPEELEELLALHCDPGKEIRKTQERCKFGPHFHVIGGGNIFQKCHIPLAYLNINDVMQSLDTLTGSFKEFVQVVEDEFCPKV